MHRYAFVLAPIAIVLVGAGPSTRVDQKRILEAICSVESQGREDCPDGDGGLAIGPYQIFLTYWYEAVEFDPSIGGSYWDCKKRSYAQKVVQAYMRRHVPVAWKNADAEVIARTHNGGPRGASIGATLPYWDKVKGILAKKSRRALSVVHQDI